MFLWAAAFCLGVIILYCVGILLPGHAYIPILLIAFIYFRSAVFWGVFFLVLGHFYANFTASQHESSILPAEYENETVELNVYLCSLPKIRTRYRTAEFCVISFQALHDLTKLKSKTPLKYSTPLLGSSVVLYWPEHIKLNIESPLLKLTVRLKRPHGTLNSVGSVYEKYLFYQRISATGVVLASGNNIKAESLTIYSKVKLAYVVFRLKLSHYLDKLFEDLEHSGLFKALLLGDRSSISPLDSRTLNDSGTQHLMAISGLHVGVVLLGLFSLLPKNKSMLILISFTGLFYIALVGFSASAQRAWVMCVMVMIYLAGYGSSNRLHVFITALTIVLLIDPMAPLNLGFWFSFICVALLLFLSAFVPINKSAWYSFLAVQLLLFVGLTPINSYLGVPHSLSNGLANLIAIPFVSILVLPGALIAFFVSLVNVGLGQVMFFLLNEVMHLLMTFLASLDAIAKQESIDGGLFITLGLVICLAYGVILFRFKGLLLSSALTIGLLFFVPSNKINPVNQLVVFDSGQGLALALVWAEQVWLYDTGAIYERSSVAENIILPYLRSNLLHQSVTGMIISHGDSDYAGGATPCLQIYCPNMCGAAK